MKGTRRNGLYHSNTCFRRNSEPEPELTPEPIPEPIFLTPQSIPSHYPSTIIETDTVNAKPTLDISVKIEE